MWRNTVYANVGRPKTSDLTRSEQLRVNQRKSQGNKKEKGNVRLEIWLQESLRDQLTEDAKKKGLSRSEYILSLITDKAT